MLNKTRKKNISVELNVDNDLVKFQFCPKRCFYWRQRRLKFTCIPLSWKKKQLKTQTHWWRQFLHLCLILLS